MIAPGDNLEFEESDWFTYRINDDPEFRKRVLEHIRNQPNLKTKYAGNLEYYTVTFEGSQYRVITRRVRNDIHLIYVFEWPSDKKHFESRKEYLEVAYGLVTKKKRSEK